MAAKTKKTDGSPRLEAVAPVRRKTIKGPPIGEDLDGIGPGGWTPRDDGLPADCPVTALGTQGNSYFFLDALGQVIELQAREFSQNGHFSLFGGDRNYLCWAWPKWRNAGTKQIPEWEVCNYESQDVSAQLMAACHRRGVWQEDERLRGRGGWAGRDGRLILHCGDLVWDGGKYFSPGIIDGYVYPALRELPKPMPVVDPKSPLHPGRLLDHIKSWRWKRPGLDPHLLLGQIAAGYLGAALDWRPIIYLYGDKGTGKSTLQELISDVMGPWRILTTNTTAAGIYQHVRHDSIAVAVDEMEGKADNRGNQSVMELARQAASGGRMLRGGSDGTGTEFQARSSFMFSSINPPPMEPSDLSRMGLLRLEPFRKEDREPCIDPDELPVIGRMVLRALVDGWKRFKPLKAEYDVILRSQGHDERGCATFGTLLVLQEIVLGERAKDYGVTALNRDLWDYQVERDLMAEYDDIIPNWRKALNRLLTAPVDQWRGGGKICIGDEIEQFYRTHPDQRAPYDANKYLAHAGCKLVKRRGGAQGWWLAVPSDDPATAKLFTGSIWAGGWKYALQQGDEGTLWQAEKVTINGARRNCTAISLDALYRYGNKAEGIAPGIMVRGENEEEDKDDEY